MVGRRALRPRRYTCPLTLHVRVLSVPRIHVTSRLLGTLALRTGKVVKWDAAGMKGTNAPEAQPFIEGTYRKGWELAV